MKVKATYRKGVLKPVKRLNLQEGQSVMLQIKTAKTSRRSRGHKKTAAKKKPGWMDPRRVSRWLEKLASLPAEGDTSDREVSAHPDRYIYK